MNIKGLVVAALLAMGSIFLVVKLTAKNDATPDTEKGAAKAKQKQDTPEVVAVLDPDKQKHIWDAEHVTFEIERRLGPLLLDAIQQKDIESLVARCHSDFTGRIPTSTNSVVQEKPPLIERSLPKDFEAKEASPAETMQHIIGLNETLTKVRRRRLRVLSIVNDDAEPTLWRCRFLLTMSGEGKDGGRQLVESESSVDIRFEDDSTLTTEPAIAAWHVNQQTERFCEKALMQEVTTKAGLRRLELPDNWKVPPKSALQYQFQMAVEDFDRDGDPDVTLTTVAGRRFVLVNEDDGKLVDRTAELGLPKRDIASGQQKFMAVWFDYDNDGYPDLLSGTELFHNDGGESFTNVTKKSRLKFDPETMGATVADYNGDGLLDLYILYQKPQMADSEFKQQAKWVDETDTGKVNQLWKNLGKGRFLNVSIGAKAGGYKRHTHSASWFHYDDDHWPDLYIANDFGRNVVLRNTGNGKFEDASDESGASGFATSMGVCTGDVDNNGTADIYVANMYSKMGRRIIGMVSPDDYPEGIYPQIQGSCAGNRLYNRDAATGSQFTEISDDAGVNAVGWAWGPAMFDADNDGLLDLYATTGFMSFERGKPDG
ncbi:VCBS repeat-containing protein [bacterium]|nr:VCBS repeat-containing protein [bacterium]